MRKKILLSILGIFLSIGCISAQNVIRVNQLGYLEDDVKVAVMLVKDKAFDSRDFSKIKIINAKTHKSHDVDKVTETQAWEPMTQSLRIDFSTITEPGEYYIEAPGTRSGVIKVGNDTYKDAHEIPLHYMRQQRCGYNPSLNDSCHTHDGRLVLSGKDDGKYVDVTGGWHDASDYLQYLTTSANAVYQMLFAYKMTPHIWQDLYDSNGKKGSNNIPDILDEARWGLQWMMKMNPSDTLFLNQIADDRDHRFAGLPADDPVDYGWGEGKERPVYPCSGKPYGLMDNYNDSKGLASSVGKFCSSFGLGAEIFAEIDTLFSSELTRRSKIAYDLAKANPGACQTAPCASPYYYEEDNWTDDMELAAITMFHATRQQSYLVDAVNYGRIEPVTPWM